MKTKFGKLFLIGCCLWISVEAQGQTQLKFWLNSSLGAHEKAAYQKAADEYSQKNPNVIGSATPTGQNLLLSWSRSSGQGKSV